MLDFVPSDHPLNQLSPNIVAKLREAQQALLERCYANAEELFSDAVDGLRIPLAAPAELRDKHVSSFAALGGSDLRDFCHRTLTAAGFPTQTLAHHAISLAQRIQLLLAFSNPDAAVEFATAKVLEVASGFPSTAADIECGRNPGDVLDPYILAATQYLLYGGNFDSAINATVAHKALMMIEGLMGHLHEDLVGLMRGNIRAPEPRGEDQEVFNLLTNPFPGADVVQPPHHEGCRPKFHQIKSKTGSAKGGDAKRLGDQLAHLGDYYGGETYYHALIGNTLRGHRSMSGVLRASPNTIVLVGNASFKVLSGMTFGPELLLRVYQAAFSAAAQAAKYNIDTMSKVIVATFQERSQATGDTYIETILHDTMRGDPASQDSRLFTPPRRGRRPD
jgi:hypothetical protein